MDTFELLIVFAALIAVIALVAIAIDWVGRPLKNRRFIPRIYRYDDEIVPEYESPMANVAVPQGVPAPVAVAPPPVLPPPMHHPPVVATIPAELAPRPPAAAPAAPASAAAPVVPAASASPTAAPVAGSAFSGQIDDGETTLPNTRTGRSDGIAETVADAGVDTWMPGMPLDTRAGDSKPTMAVKAERFWRAIAANVSSPSHFDEADLARMHAGRAPTRRNPRTGETEAMELVGLRSASHRSDVRMMWPDPTVDPWSAS